MNDINRIHIYCELLIIKLNSYYYYLLSKLILLITMRGNNCSDTGNDVAAFTSGHIV